MTNIRYWHFLEVPPAAVNFRAAAHESGSGTFETCRLTLSMTAYQGRAEMIGALSKRRE